MSLKTKCCSGLAVAGTLLLVASCAEGPTLPLDNGEVGAVLKKGGPKGPQLREVNVAIPSPSDFPGNALIGDGLVLTEGLYEGGKCGVVALAGSSFSFFPFYGGMNKKQLRDFEKAGECGWNHDSPTDSTAVRRWMRVDLAAAKVHVGPDHIGELTLGEMIGLGSMDSIGTDDVMNHAKVSIFDGSGTYDSRGSFGVPYCNYLMFNAGGAPGSNDLRVTQSTGTVRVETQPGPNNVGLCAHDTGGAEPLEILLHLDIAYDVINQ
jgi:hypothetical protein